MKYDPIRIRDLYQIPNQSRYVVRFSHHDEDGWPTETHEEFVLTPAELHEAITEWKTKREAKT